MLDCLFLSGHADGLVIIYNVLLLLLTDNYLKLEFIKNYRIRIQIVSRHVPDRGQKYEKSFLPDLYDCDLFIYVPPSDDFMNQL